MKPPIHQKKKKKTISFWGYKRHAYSKIFGQNSYSRLPTYIRRVAEECHYL